MKKNMSLNYCVFAILSLLLLSNCNSGTTPATAKDTPASNSKVPAHEGDLTFSGNLDTLYIDSLSFTNLDTGKNENIIMQFVFGNNNRPTLHGWKVIKKTKEDSFAVDPAIKLLNGGTSEVSFGPATYWGNVILGKKGLKEIIKQLKTKKSQFVAFVPLKSNEHIFYDIILINGTYAPFTPTKRPFWTSSPTGFSMNPSPPRSYEY